MRIIAGEFKGRKLESPKDDSVRPTADKVKEAMFSILQNYIYDGVFCDLFAGSGGLGLEAVSRGAKKVYFCDIAASSIEVLNKNIETCRAEEKSVVFRGDFKTFLNSIDDKIDVFLLDPPYRIGYIEEAMKVIKDMDLLAEEGIIVAEHPKEENFQDEIYGFKKIKEKKYGRLVLSIFI